MQSFDLCHANQLSVSDAKEYIKQYFYPLSSGLHIQVDYEDEKPIYEIKEDKVIKSVYFNRLPKVIYDFYFKEYDQSKIEWLEEKLAILVKDTPGDSNITPNHKLLLKLSTQLYENGYSCLDITKWLKTQKMKWNDLEKSNVIIHFQKIKSEFRCEKMLMFHLLEIICFRSNTI